MGVQRLRQKVALHRKHKVNKAYFCLAIAVLTDAISNGVKYNLRKDKGITRGQARLKHSEDFIMGVGLEMYLEHFLLPMTAESIRKKYKELVDRRVHTKVSLPLESIMLTPEPVYKA